MTPQQVRSSVREWTRRIWGALAGCRTDHDLQRELADANENEWKAASSSGGSM